MKSNINDSIFLKDVCVRIVCLEEYEEDMISKIAYQEVKKFATDLYGISDWTIEKDCKGKPHFLTKNDYFFSVSHTGKMVAIAMYKGKAVGIDIEIIRSISNKIVDKYYTKYEKERVNQLYLESIIESIKIWTLKEAHCKCTGTGLDKFSLRWDTINQTEMVTESRQIGKYIVSVCKPMGNNIPFQNS